MRLPRTVLMFVTAPAPDLPAILASAIDGGVNAVILRDPEASAAELEAQARLLRTRIGSRALLMVNGADVAEADGIHLAESEPPRSRRNGRIAGRSVHSVAAAVAARNHDYLLAGTIFPSRSHPGRSPAGTGLLHDIVCATPVRVIAIGGITPENVRSCMLAGAWGVAVSSPILLSRNPRATATEYWDAIGEASQEKESA